MINPTSKIHSSWNKIKHLLNEGPLLELKEQILPNCSFQPKSEDIFNVFSMPVNQVKVVILGQDPYPTSGDAIGYAFVNGTNKTPKSLQIIEREIEQQTSYSSQGIDTWSKQGIFLLNTALTVETGNAGSHLKYWEDFTSKVIQFLSKENPCIWLLWGQKAMKYKPFIHTPHINNISTKYNKETILEIPTNPSWNYILESPHPASEAYSGGKAGFYGNNHFVFTNTILEKTGKEIINW